MLKAFALVRSIRASITPAGASLRSCTRWGAIALIVALGVPSAIYFGNQQHLKHVYARMHPPAGDPAPGGAAGTPGVTSFDAPGASTVAMQGTVALGVDSAGDVAGVFIDARSVRHGFVRAANGTISTFDAPGAGTNQTQYYSAEGTIPLSMDTAGDVAGFYVDGNDVDHGFIRSASGTITTFDAPGAYQQFGLGTIVTGVNAAGVVTGYFLDSTTYVTHAFVRSGTGTFTSFDAPGAVFQYAYKGTQPTSINAEGDVTGLYTDVNGMRHGFVRLANGTLTQFDVPGAALGSKTSKAARGTIPLGIDTAGDISGVYSDTNNLSHGFVRAANGTYTSFDAPGAGSTASAFVGIAQLLPGTGAAGINTGGAITGAYVDADSLAHGFVRAANGTITSFDAPGAGTGSGGYQGTGGATINASGTVAGTYLDENSVLHGFVYSGTAVAVTPSSSSITTAQALSVTVAVSGRSTPATGTVTLTSGTYTSAAATLSSGSATISVPAGTLATGVDTLAATYTPDAGSAATYSSASGTATVTVSTAPAATTTLTLSANPSSSTFGQQVALVATLSPFSAASVNTNGESVTFYNGSLNLGTAALSSGVASLNVTSLPAGTDSLTAVYGGDANFLTSTSAALPFSVAAVAPTITFSVPGHTYGDAPFTVSATSTSTGALTYSVVSGPATISGSTVTLTGKGAVVLQASQAAAGNFAAATQSASFAVAGESQTISFTAPASVNYGTAPITLSGTASSGLGVVFSVVSGAASVSGNTLTISGAGAVVVAADQAGNSSFAAATEVTHSITVNKISPTAIGVTASPNPVLAQSAVILTATVTSAVGTPTGSVLFVENGNTLGTGSLNGSGVATLSLTTLAGGTHSITASYDGDANFNAIASSAVIETVQDFTFSTGSGSSSQTVQPGGSATYTFPITVSGGTTLPAAVTFSATGLPPGATATFAPASLAAGSAPTNVTLTVQVTTSAMLERKGLPGGSAPLVVLALVLLPFGRKKRLALRSGKLAAVLLIGVMGMLTGCGGSNSSGGGTKQAGTYTITVTASSGTLSHATTVTLIVQ